MYPYANNKVILPVLLAIAALTAGWTLRGEYHDAAIPWGDFSPWFKIAGAGGATVAFVLFLFEKWAWRWPVIRYLMLVPRIEGRWEGTESSDTFDRGGSGPTPRPVVVMIEQSPRFISYVAHNGPSRNYGLATSFERMGDSSIYRLTVAYANHVTGTPPSENTRSHCGAVTLDLSAEPRKCGRSELVGRYWTDKLRDKNDGLSGGTAGSLQLKLIDERPSLPSRAELAR